MENYIREAIKLAAAAKEKGNHPFGAILVVDDAIVLSAENTVVTDKDPTCHAEMNLIRYAWKELSPDQIHAATLYTSTEPCPMCCGAIFWSGIRTIVFSTSASTLGSIANDSFCRPCTGLFENVTPTTQVIGPILAEEGDMLHVGFWDFLEDVKAANASV